LKIAIGEKLLLCHICC